MVSSNDHQKRYSKLRSINTAITRAVSKKPCRRDVSTTSSVSLSGKRKNLITVEMVVRSPLNAMVKDT